MENFTSEIAKIVGTAKEDQWAQVFSQDGLLVVIAVEGGEDHQEVTLGKELLAKLWEKYSAFSAKNLKELEEALAEIKKETEGKKVFLLVAMVVGRVLYLACLGGGRAQIKRDKTLVSVLAGEESASGFLKDGDLLLLATPQLDEIISSQTLAENFDGAPTEIAENLAPFVQGAEENALCAALVIRFSASQPGFFPQEAGETEEKKRRILPNLSFLGKILPRHLRLRLPLSGQEKSRRTLLTVATLLVALLSLSIFLGLSQKAKTQKTEKFGSLYQAALEKYEEGKSLAGLNNLLSRQALFLAKDNLSELQKLPKLSRQEKKKIEELGKKIEESLLAVGGVYQLSQTPLFLDLNLVKAGGQGKKLALYKKTLAVLDGKNQAAYTVSLKNKSSQIVAGGEKLEEAREIGIHGSRLYLATKEGILEVETEKQSTTLVVKRDPDWGEIVDLFAYGGNLYLLDKGKNQIWKYIKTESGFSDKRNYLNRDVRPDFQKVVSFAIDGVIWVLYQDGEVLKFLQGRPEIFSLSGLDTPFSQPLAIFTSDETKNLYILDPAGKRIVVFEKSGSYLAQYLSEELGNAQDLVVDEEEKKIFVLSSNKIYAIELK